VRGDRGGARVGMVGIGREHRFHEVQCDHRLRGVELIARAGDELVGADEVDRVGTRVLDENRWSVEPTIQSSSQSSDAPALTYSPPDHGVRADGSPHQGQTSNLR
jgi:hypothetical protein